MSDQFLYGLATSLPSGVRNFLGQRQEQLASVKLIGRALLGLRHRQAVEADVDLDDVLDAVLLAVLELALLHAARGVGRVRMRLADAGAEQLHAAAGAGRFDDRGLDAAGLAELLGNRGGERINGGRSDDADLVARFGARQRPGRSPAAQRAQRAARGSCFTVIGYLQLSAWMRSAAFKLAATAVY